MPTTRTVNQSLIEQAILETEDATVHPMDLRARYSGRGMYGDECFGVVADSDAQFARFLVEVAALDADLARDLAARLSTDSMGMGRIYYFRGLTLDDDNDDNDDEEEERP